MMTFGRIQSKYIKIKINSDIYVLLNGTLFISDVVILIRSAFEDDGTYYSQIFLEEALYVKEKYKIFKNIKMIQK